MKKILVLACFVLVFLSCNSCDDDSCAPVTLSITSLEEEYSCVNTPYQMDIDVSDEFIIIRSQADFDALVTGSCMPQIDFITYDLLIGKKALTNGVESINYDGLVKDCENGQLSLTVTFVKNDTDEAPNLTYHALVPKLELDDIINVSIVMLN